MFASDHLPVENVAVEPARRRRGLGRVLLAHAGSVAAAAARLRAIRLDVRLEHPG